MSIKNTKNTNSPLIEPFSSCSKKLFSRKGSLNSEIEILNLPLKIPQKVLHLFNSISDFYNNKNISDAIKDLKNVKDRLILIDLILKRRNEVNQIEELSQITKLRPLFEKIKNRFKKNMNKSTISPSLNIIKSPETNKGESPSLPRSPTLFIPNSIDPRHNPKRVSILNAVTSFNSRNNKKEINNDQIEKIKSGVKAIETNFPFIDVKNIEKSHLINPFKPDQEENKEKFKNFKGTRRNSFCTSNNPFREKLEKDIYKVFVKNKLSIDFFENEKFSLSHKNLTLIEKDVLNIINNKIVEKNIKKPLVFPSFALKRKKEEKKKIMSFHNINKKKSLTIFKNVPEGDNDDSFASYTEVKLDQLYKASWTINQQLKHLENNGIGDQNTHIKELKIKKNDELTKTQRYYDLKWKEAINDVTENIKIENFLLDKNEGGLGMGHKFTEYEIFLHYANLYIKYIDSFKKLEDCYDQLVHPQKRILLKEMLENTIVRIVELKNELIKRNTHHDQVQSDFVNLDELLMDLKLPVDSIEFILPRYFKEEDPDKQRDERNQAIDKLLVQFHDTSLPEEEVIEYKAVLEANPETAIRIIQKNERGRQGIEAALKSKYRKKEELKKQKMLQQGNEISEENQREEAIMVVQKYYRGYKARECVDKLRQDELLFLGMKKDDLLLEENSDLKKFQKQRIDMKLIKNVNEKEYQEELINQKKLIKENEEADIKEDMLLKRREWIEKYRDMYDFQQLPNGIEEFYERNDVMMPLTPEEQEAKRVEEEAKAKEEKKKKEQKKAGKKPTKKTDLEEFLDSRGKTGPTEIVYKLQENMDKYNKDWASRELMKNFEQKHEVDYAKEKVRPDVEEEIRATVDEMITIYLDNLRTTKKKKGGRGKGGKGKGGKGKIKPPKIPGLLQVSKRDPKDLLSELVEAQIVKKLQPAKIDDFIGEPDNLGCLAERQMKRMPDPSYQQLRQNIRELIGFPLGSSSVRQKLDTKNKISFLFYGPAGTGKTMMVRALAEECDAMILDLSASNLENKYMDKESTKKLVAMTYVVAKNFQPAIIYIDECELIHPGGKKKKVGSGTASRIKKLLSDYKNKYLVPKEDRVAIIGCTNKPFECNMKEIKAFYDKKFYFPFPNYPTRKLLFKKIMLQKGISLPDGFSLSTIAHISEGYTAGSFKMAIDKVITERRKIQLKERPLTIQEFIGPLSASFFTSSDIYQKIITFTEDATGLKERRDKKNNPQTDDDPKKNKNKKK